jgi:polyisoprenoid-binding protein YceI
MKVRLKLYLMPIALIATAGMLHAATTLRYRITDPGSEAVAKVAFMGLSSKSARFGSISGDIAFSPGDLKNVKVDVAIDASKLRAGDRTTEKQLKAKDFFWVERYPTVRFTATSLAMKNKVQGTLNGNLTARGVTNPVSMAVTFSAPPSTANGQDQLSLTGTTVINRQAFGMTAYSAIVGKKVNITIRAALKGG